MQSIKYYLAAALWAFVATQANAESLRCKGDLVEIGDTKADVIQKCGEPESTDSFCKKYLKTIEQANGKLVTFEDCENVDMWTYNPGAGQFLTNLYFAEGKLREMKYGDRVK